MGLLAKGGNRRFWLIWPIWWQSPIWVMPADLPIKLDPAVLADLVVKRGIGGLADSELNRGIDGFGCFGAEAGIDRFAGKSEITEGCSDLREIGDSSDLPGISDVRLSKSYGSDAADDATSVSRGIEKCRSIGIEKCRSVVGGAS